MIKFIDLGKLTNGKFSGEIEVSARYWETRYSWGHTAEVSVNYHTVATCRIRYYNRTWEEYRFQSALHGALHAYVKYLTGIDPYRGICKRDQKPMKDAAAESRRLARIEAYETARGLYDALCGVVDGRITHNEKGEEVAA